MRLLFTEDLCRGHRVTGIPASTHYRGEMFLIRRTFHPIGQGAFYSERHDDFKMVYDCGNSKNTKLADDVVRQAFQKDEIIDILFISHFDYDHVNKIKTLKDHVKIKIVIMPLLHDEQKQLIINVYRALPYHILSLISAPGKFFGNETRVITVESTENDETPIGNEIEPQDIDEITSSSIASGSVLRKKNATHDWVFIPYNYAHTSRNKKLELLLSKNGFNVQALKVNSDYASKIAASKSMRKKIKEIYSSLGGNINQNSMLLYSGPNSSVNPCIKHRHHGCCYNRIKYCKKVGCLYTGDANLNIVNIQQVLRRYWGNVGTIQIPHHGDIESFNQNILDDKCHYCCPISVGKNNSYGHPSDKVIANVISKGSFPILVTEELSSVFVECIKCY